MRSDIVQPGRRVRERVGGRIEAGGHAGHMRDERCAVAVDLPTMSELGETACEYGLRGSIERGGRQRGSRRRLRQGEQDLRGVVDGRVLGPLVEELPHAVHRGRAVARVHGARVLVGGLPQSQTQR
ncbi:hypothetical protein [Microbacterium aurum]